jgi:DNA-binding XRE family transcriptional regulator
MRLSDFKTNAEVLAGDLASDPGFRAVWERTALARAVSLVVLRYRTEHGLSQTGLARRVGMSQQRVARLELGEDDPTIDTLMQLSSGLGVEFKIHIRPNIPLDVVAVGV